jgi:tRNA dimethylallyltransferase
MQTNFPVTIITGPTCSGKSAHALGLAKKLNGVIINADAMQLYRDLPVLTAQPTLAEQEQAPHRLYSVLDGQNLCTVARWVGMATDVIREAWSAGQHPLLVGGTGMYLKALIEGLAEVPPVAEAIRQEMRARMVSEGNAAFYAWFAERDPDMAGRLKPGDTQRLLRAAEVYAGTGRSLAAWQAEPVMPTLPEAVFHLTAITRERAALYQRIDKRFLAMLENGALEEVDRLRARHLPDDLPVMRSHGVPELMATLEGRLPMEEAIAKGQRNTRRYAKRQWTWIRNQFPQAEWVELRDQTV